jgi:hypothetical protein
LKGYAVIFLEKPKQVEHAIAALDNFNLEGKTIRASNKLTTTA